MLYVYGVDMRTADAKQLIRRLKRLRDVKDAVLQGVYHQDVSYCQVYVTVDSMPMEWLEDWLYNVNHGCDYVGVFYVDKTEDM